MRNKSNTRNIVGIVLVVLIGLGVWSMVSTKMKWKYSDLGLAEYEKGNYQEAIEHYDKAIGSNPSDAFLYNNRGLAYVEFKKHDKAILDYNKAIELKPDYAVAYCNRGIAYFKNGAFGNIEPYNKAIADFTKAIELDTKYVNAYYNRGLAYNQFVHYAMQPYTEEIVDKYHKAVGGFNKALELDPGYVLAMAGRGNAYYRYGKWAEAAGEYNKALELKEKIIEKSGKKGLAGVYSSSGRNYVALDEFEKAASAYEKALELDPELMLAISYGAYSYGRIKKYDKALELYSKAIDLIKKKFKKDVFAAESYAGRATIYYHLGQFDKAILDFKKAVMPGTPFEAHAHRYLAKIYLKTGDGEKAKEEFNKAIQVYSGRIKDKGGPIGGGWMCVAYIGRGLCYLDLEQYDQAILDLKKVIELKSLSDHKMGHSNYYAEAHKSLGLVYWKMGDKEKAKNYFEKAIELFEKRGQKFTAREIRDLFKTGEIEQLSTET